MKNLLTSPQLDPSIYVCSINDTIDEVSEMYDLSVNSTLERLPIFLIFPDNDTPVPNLDVALVKNFVEDIKKENDIDNDDINIIVHCFAGISRSAAVAKAIRTYFGIDNDKYTLYNKVVFNSFGGVLYDTMSVYYKNLENENKGI